MVPGRDRDRNTWLVFTPRKEDSAGLLTEILETFKVRFIQDFGSDSPIDLSDFDNMSGFGESLLPLKWLIILKILLSIFKDILGQDPLFDKISTFPKGAKFQKSPIFALAIQWDTAKFSLENCVVGKVEIPSRKCHPVSI